MGRIRLLSKELINQIAAGEVIERPASVVKELLENSIDAGAGSISVEVEESGLGLIRVTDDGGGMDEEDLQLSLKSHSTSKISETADLFSIGTLGFRGEALASIASVSRFSVASRTGALPFGFSVEGEAGAVCRTEKKGMPVGTVIEVKDLFFNTPARRKFLKTVATEQKNIIDVITRYALAYPSIRFTLHSSSRTIFNLNKGTLEERAEILLGSEFKKKMRTFYRDGETITVEGLLATPDLSRQNRGSIYLFVNKRSVRDTMLSSAVLDGFREFMTKGRYPLAITFIKTSPEEIDVNVHPAKAEVRFREPSKVFGLVSASIKEALKKSDSNNSIITDSTTFRHMEIKPDFSKAFANELPRQNTVHQERIFEDKSSGFYSSKKIIGSLFSSYILLEEKDLFYILDQHAAHERVNFEKLKNFPEKPAVQQLLTPVIIELTKAEQSIFSGIQNALESIGIETSAFGENDIAVRAIPSFINAAFIKDIISDLLENFANEKPMQSDVLENILAGIACHKSLKSGTQLSSYEIKGLLGQLDLYGSPLTCPHGRPIFKEISRAEIERWMKRRL